MDRLCCRVQLCPGRRHPRLQEDPFEPYNLQMISRVMPTVRREVGDGHAGDADAILDNIYSTNVRTYARLGVRELSFLAYQLRIL